MFSLKSSRRVLLFSSMIRLYAARDSNPISTGQVVRYPSVPCVAIGAKTAKATPKLFGEEAAQMEQSAAPASNPITGKR